jgi:tRNA A-37 threonylcarbamoyl transferase component Bud32
MKFIKFEGGTIRRRRTKLEARLLGRARRSGYWEPKSLLTNAYKISSSFQK